MSAIHPPVPSPLFPKQSPGPALAPTRVSRSDFFRTALGGVAAPAETAPAARAESRPIASRAVSEGSQRPGSLVDIRV